MQKTAIYFLFLVFFIASCAGNKQSVKTNSPESIAPSTITQNSSLPTLESHQFACDLSFRINDSSWYQINGLDAFVREKIRPVLKKDDSTRFDILMVSHCVDSTKNDSISLQMEKDNYYIRSLKGMPLCAETLTTQGVRCLSGQYNYVDYKGGSSINIDSLQIVTAYNALVSIDSVAQLIGANRDSAEEKKIHDAIRVFAFVFAEASRFDYVLDDLWCVFNKRSEINFMNYWTLLHNWGTISSRVQKYKPDLIDSTKTYFGSGILLAPVTRNMIPFFNHSLDSIPPSPRDTTRDGKNKPIPVKDPVCEMP